jgi:hypothetical protein
MGLGLGLVVVLRVLPAAPLNELLDQRRKLKTRRLLSILWEHDDAAEQAAVHALADVPGVVVERPRADHFAGHLEPIGPALPRTDLVRPPPIRGLGAERPRPVGVDAVPQAVHVEAVRHHVRVEHVDLQPLPGLGVDHGARNAVRVHRLVDIRLHQLVRLGDEVVRVEVLPVHQRVQPPRVHLRQRNGGILVPGVAHAVPAV